MVQQVALLGPPAHSTEARHAVLHVGDEALASLFAVVADVDAGVQLGRDHLSGGRRDHLLEFSLRPSSRPGCGDRAARPGGPASASCLRAW